MIYEKFEMPVDESNMHEEVKRLIAEMNEHNKQYPGLARKIVNIKSWSEGFDDGDTDTDFWQVVIYEPLTELFYIHKIVDAWHFNGRKVYKYMISLSKSDILGFMGDALKGVA